MKIVIEIDVYEDHVTMPQALNELAEIIQDSKPKELERKVQRLSAENINVVIRREQ